MKKVTEGIMSERWIGEYQRDNRWLRNRILVKMTEGNISEAWIGEYQRDNGAEK